MHEALCKISWGFSRSYNIKNLHFSSCLKLIFQELVPAQLLSATLKTSLQKLKKLNSFVLSTSFSSLLPFQYVVFLLIS